MGLFAKKSEIALIKDILKHTPGSRDIACVDRRGEVVEEGYTHYIYDEKASIYRGGGKAGA